MEEFILREREIFRVLEKLKKIKKLVLIGAYALNAYVDFPRFSIDCDLVVFEEKEVEKILKTEGYKLIEKQKDFIRLGKKINSVKSGIDVLIKKIVDRQSGITFEFSDVFQDSSLRELPAKSDPILKIEARVASPEILFVMKIASMRRQDIRDIFMLSSYDLDRARIRKLIGKYFPRELLKRRIERLIEFLESRYFLSSIQGVYGKLPEEFVLGNRKRLINLIKTK